MVDAIFGIIGISDFTTLIKQLFNKTIIYFYGKSIQMEIINNIILETRAYS